MSKDIECRVEVGRRIGKNELIFTPEIEYGGEKGLLQATGWSLDAMVDLLRVAREKGYQIVFTTENTEDSGPIDESDERYLRNQLGL